MLKNSIECKKHFNSSAGRRPKGGNPVSSRSEFGINSTHREMDGIKENKEKKIFNRDWKRLIMDLFILFLFIYSSCCLIKQLNAILTAPKKRGKLQTQRTQRKNKQKKYFFSRSTTEGR